jgi:hypothetical protein
VPPTSLATAGGAHCACEHSLSANDTFCQSVLAAMTDHHAMVFLSLYLVRVALPASRLAPNHHPLRVVEIAFAKMLSKNQYRPVRLKQRGAHSCTVKSG